MRRKNSKLYKSKLASARRNFRNLQKRDAALKEVQEQRKILEEPGFPEATGAESSRSTALELSSVPEHNSRFRGSPPLYTQGIHRHRSNESFGQMAVEENLALIDSDEKNESCETDFGMDRKRKEELLCIKMQDLNNYKILKSVYVKEEGEKENGELFVKIKNEIALKAEPLDIRMGNSKKAKILKPLFKINNKENGTYELDIDIKSEIEIKEEPLYIKVYDSEGNEILKPIYGKDRTQDENCPPVLDINSEIEIKEEPLDFRVENSKFSEILTPIYGEDKRQNFISEDCKEKSDILEGKMSSRNDHQELRRDKGTEKFDLKKFKCSNCDFNGHKCALLVYLRNNYNYIKNIKIDKYNKSDEK